MKLNFRRSIALLVSLCYFTTQVALGSLAESSIWADRRRPALKEIALSSAKVLSSTTNTKWPAALRPLLSSLPLSNGIVQDVYDSQDKNNAPVLLLQDIHQNAEAQMNLARMLAAAIEQKQVDRVGVEGAFNVFDFSVKDRKRAAGMAADFLAKNRITAPTYVGLTSSAALPQFVGVDDREHYAANVEAYLDSQDVKARVSQELEEAEKKITADKERSFSKELKEFDVLRNAHPDLGVYVQKLLAISRKLEARAYGLQPTAYSPAIENFSEAYLLETTLNFDRVDAERKRVIETLTRKLTQGEIAALTLQTLDYRMGRSGFGDYYGNLKKLCESKGVSLASAPAFNDYIRYVLLADQIKAGEVLASVAKLEQSVVTLLAKTPEEKRLMAESEHLALTRKLVEHTLTADEWERYKLLAVSRKREDLKAFEDFYRQADIRSEKMLSNLLKANSLKLTAYSSAVLVAGGFHTSEITALLRRKKISYAVVSPKITKLEGLNGSEYLSVFSREKSPLATLFSGKKLFINPARAASVGSVAEPIGPRVLEREEEIAQRTQKAIGLNPQISKAIDKRTSRRGFFQAAAAIGLLLAIGSASDAQEKDAEPIARPPAIPYSAENMLEPIEKNRVVGFGMIHFLDNPARHFVDAVGLFLEKHPKQNLVIALEIGPRFEQAANDYVQKKRDDIHERIILPGAGDVLKAARKWTEEGHTVKIVFFDNREFNPIQGFSHDTEMADEILKKIGKDAAQKIFVFAGRAHIEKRNLVVEKGELKPSLMRVLKNRLGAQGTYSVGIYTARDEMEATVDGGPLMDHINGIQGAGKSFFLGNFGDYKEFGQQPYMPAEILADKNKKDKYGRKFAEPGPIKDVIDAAIVDVPVEKKEPAKDTRTHHLPRYLWIPFRDRLNQAMKESPSESFKLAHDRVVTQGLGVARTENGTLFIEEEVLPYLVEVLNRELKESPPSSEDAPLDNLIDALLRSISKMKIEKKPNSPMPPWLAEGLARLSPRSKDLTIEDVHAYLTAHESYHQQLREDPELLDMFAIRLRDPANYYGADSYEKFKRRFANNYGDEFMDDNLFAEELLVVAYTERAVLSQSVKVLPDKSKPAQRADIPNGVQQLLVMMDHVRTSDSHAGAAVISVGSEWEITSNGDMSVTPDQVTTLQTILAELSAFSPETLLTEIVLQPIPGDFIEADEQRGTITLGQDAWRTPELLRFTVARALLVLSSKKSILSFRNDDAFRKRAGEFKKTIAENPGHLQKVWANTEYLLRFDFDLTGEEVDFICAVQTSLLFDQLVPAGQREDLLRAIPDRKLSNYLRESADKETVEKILLFAALSPPSPQMFRIIPDSLKPAGMETVEVMAADELTAAADNIPEAEYEERILDAYMNEIRKSLRSQNFNSYPIFSLGHSFKPKGQVPVLVVRLIKTCGLLSIIERRLERLPSATFAQERLNEIIPADTQVHLRHWYGAQWRKFVAFCLSPPMLGFLRMFPDSSRRSFLTSALGDVLERNSMLGEPLNERVALIVRVFGQDTVNEAFANSPSDILWLCASFSDADRLAWLPNLMSEFEQLGLGGSLRRAFVEDPHRVASELDQLVLMRLKRDSFRVPGDFAYVMDDNTSAEIEPITLEDLVGFGELRQALRERLGSVVDEKIESDPIGVMVLFSLFHNGVYSLRQFDRHIEKYGKPIFVGILKHELAMMPAGLLVWERFELVFNGLLSEDKLRTVLSQGFERLITGWGSLGDVWFLVRPLERLGYIPLSDILATIASPTQFFEEAEEYLESAPEISRKTIRWLAVHSPMILCELMEHPDEPKPWDGLKNLIGLKGLSYLFRHHPEFIIDFFNNLHFVQRGDDLPEPDFAGLSRITKQGWKRVLIDNPSIMFSVLTGISTLNSSIPRSVVQLGKIVWGAGEVRKHMDWVAQVSHQIVSREDEVHALIGALNLGVEPWVRAAIHSLSTEGALRPGLREACLQLLRRTPHAYQGFLRSFDFLYSLSHLIGESHVDAAIVERGEELATILSGSNVGDLQPLFDSFGLSADAGGTLFVQSPAEMFRLAEAWGALTPQSREAAESQLVHWRSAAAPFLSMCLANVSTFSLLLETLPQAHAQEDAAQFVARLFLPALYRRASYGTKEDVNLQARVREAQSAAVLYRNHLGVSQEDVLRAWAWVLDRSSLPIDRDPGVDVAGALLSDADTVSLVETSLTQQERGSNSYRIAMGIAVQVPEIFRRSVAAADDVRAAVLKQDAPLQLLQRRIEALRATSSAHGYSSTMAERLAIDLMGAPQRKPSIASREPLSIALHSTPPAAKYKAMQETVDYTSLETVVKDINGLGINADVVDIYNSVSPAFLARFFVFTGDMMMVTGRFASSLREFLRTQADFQDYLVATVAAGLRKDSRDNSFYRDALRLLLVDTAVARELLGRLKSNQNLNSSQWRQLETDAVNACVENNFNSMVSSHADSITHRSEGYGLIQLATKLEESRDVSVHSIRHELQLRGMPLEIETVQNNLDPFLYRSWHQMIVPRLSLLRRGYRGSRSFDDADARYITRSLTVALRYAWEGGELAAGKGERVVHEWSFPVLAERIGNISIRDGEIGSFQPYAKGKIYVLSVSRGDLYLHEDEKFTLTAKIRVPAEGAIQLVSLPAAVKGEAPEIFQVGRSGSRLYFLRIDKNVALANHFDAPPGAAAYVRQISTEGRADMEVARLAIRMQVLERMLNEEIVDAIGRVARASNFAEAQWALNTLRSALNDLDPSVVKDNPQYDPHLQTPYFNHVYGPLKTAVAEMAEETDLERIKDKVRSSETTRWLQMEQRLLAGTMEAYSREFYVDPYHRGRENRRTMGNRFLEMLRTDAHPAAAIRRLFGRGDMDYFLQEIAALRGVTQGTGFHQGIGADEHTLRVVDEMENLVRDPRYEIQDPKELFLLALFHDVGKANGGRRGHSDRSVESLRQFLLGVEAPLSIIDRLSTLIRVHQALGNMTASVVRRVASGRESELISDDFTGRMSADVEELAIALSEGASQEQAQKNLQDLYLLTIADASAIPFPSGDTGNRYTTLFAHHLEEVKNDVSAAIGHRYDPSRPNSIAYYHALLNDDTHEVAKEKGLAGFKWEVLGLYGAILLSLVPFVYRVWMGESVGSTLLFARGVIALGLVMMAAYHAYLYIELCLYNNVRPTFKRVFATFVVSLFWFGFYFLPVLMAAPSWLALLPFLAAMILAGAVHEAYDNWVLGGEAPEEKKIPKDNSSVLRTIMRLFSNVVYGSVVMLVGVFFYTTQHPLVFIGFSVFAAVGLVAFLPWVSRRLNGIPFVLPARMATGVLAALATFDVALMISDPIYRFTIYDGLVPPIVISLVAGFVMERVLVTVLSGLTVMSSLMKRPEPRGPPNRQLFRMAGFAGVLLALLALVNNALWINPGAVSTHRSFDVGSTHFVVQFHRDYEKDNRDGYAAALKDRFEALRVPMKRFMPNETIVFTAFDQKQSVPFGSVFGPGMLPAPLPQALAGVILGNERKAVLEKVAGSAAVILGSEELYGKPRSFMARHIAVEDVRPFAMDKSILVVDLAKRAWAALPESDKRRWAQWCEQRSRPGFEFVPEHMFVETFVWFATKSPYIFDRDFGGDPDEVLIGLKLDPELIQMVIEMFVDRKKSVIPIVVDGELIEVKLAAGDDVRSRVRGAWAKKRMAKMSVWNSDTSFIGHAFYYFRNYCRELGLSYDGFMPSVPNVSTSDNEMEMLEAIHSHFGDTLTQRPARFFWDGPHGQIYINGRAVVPERGESARDATLRVLRETQAAAKDSPKATVELEWEARGFFKKVEWTAADRRLVDGLLSNAHFHSDVREELQAHADFRDHHFTFDTLIDRKTWNKRDLFRMRAALRQTVLSRVQEGRLARWLLEESESLLRLWDWDRQDLFYAESLIDIYVTARINDSLTSLRIWRTNYWEDYFRVVDDLPAFRKIPVGQWKAAEVEMAEKILVRFPTLVKESDVRATAQKYETYCKLNNYPGMAENAPLNFSAEELSYKPFWDEADKEKAKSFIANPKLDRSLKNTLQERLDAMPADARAKKRASPYFFAMLITGILGGLAASGKGPRRFPTGSELTLVGKENTRTWRVIDSDERDWYLKYSQTLREERLGYAIAESMGVNVPIHTDIELGDITPDDKNHDAWASYLEDRGFQKRNQKGTMALLTRDVASMQKQDLAQQETSGLEEILVFLAYTGHADLSLISNLATITVEEKKRYVLYDLDHAGYVGMPFVGKFPGDVVMDGSDVLDADRLLQVISRVELMDPAKLRQMALNVGLSAHEIGLVEHFRERLRNVRSLVTESLRESIGHWYAGESRNRQLADIVKTLEQSAQQPRPDSESIRANMPTPAYLLGLIMAAVFTGILPFTTWTAYGSMALVAWLAVQKSSIPVAADDGEMESCLQIVEDISVALGNNRIGDLLSDRSFGLGKMGKPVFSNQEKLIGRVGVWAANASFRTKLIQRLNGRVPAGVDVDELADVTLAVLLARAAGGRSPVIGGQFVYLFKGASKTDAERQARKIGILVAMMRTGIDATHKLVTDQTSFKEVRKAAALAAKYSLLGEARITVQKSDSVIAQATLNPEGLNGQFKEALLIVVSGFDYRGKSRLVIVLEALSPVAGLNTQNVGILLREVLTKA